MKQKSKRRRIVVLLIIVGLAAALGLLVFFNLPRPLAPSDGAYSLARLADGVYAGSCDNGIVKVRLAVTVQDHAIAGVAISEHQNGLGGPAEAVADEVVARQSVEVDAVAGATLSSQSILKAIENALAKGTGVKA